MEIAGVAVEQQKDYKRTAAWSGLRRCKSTMGALSSNVLRYEMADGNQHHQVRPSAPSPRSRSISWPTARTRPCDEKVGQVCHGPRA